MLTFVATYDVNHISLYYVMQQYNVTRCYVTVRYFMLCYVTVCYITLPYIALRHSTLHCIALQQFRAACAAIMHAHVFAVLTSKRIPVSPQGMHEGTLNGGCTCTLLAFPKPYGQTVLLFVAGLRIFAACIDAELNDKGYIVPGLGDAGDRAYGTQ